MTTTHQNPSPQNTNWPQYAINTAKNLNFTLVGITPALPADHQSYFHNWLNQKNHGQMHYLENNIDLRLNPEKLLPNAKSIIAVADQYPATPNVGTALAVQNQPDSTSPTGLIARYAWGDDYHKTIKKRLFTLADSLKQQHPAAQFKVTVDTAPIFERQHAQRANLGWIAKNTLLINKQLGSYFLLGLIITTLDSRVRCADHLTSNGWLGQSRRSAVAGEATTHNQATPPTSHCGSCTRCIDACPTKCITPYQLNASKCISYLTLEHRSEIPPDLHEPINQHIAGCDICQQVCPFNNHLVAGAESKIGRGGRSAAPEPGATGGLPASASHPPHHPAYTPRPPAPSIPLLDILNWTEQDRRDTFRKSALKRIKLDMLYRNAIIAAGNYLKTNQDKPLLARIQQLKNDKSQPPLIRNTAAQVCDGWL